MFWITHPQFDVMKKRTLLALIILLMSSAWLPIARELFLGIMNTEIYAGLLIGHIIALLGVIGAWGLYKRRWF